MSAGSLAHPTVEGRSTIDDLRTSATALAIALLALNVLDIVVTRLAIEQFGAIEVNPLMAPIIETPTAPALKALVPLVVLALATRVRTRLAVTTLRVVVGIYLAVVIIGTSQVAWMIS